MNVYVGIAGWNVPKEHAAQFPVEGSHLERYARTFPAVEINSSFYRPHQPKTYTRWAASVPADFRFAAKVPREITHRQRLVDVVELLDRFLGEVTELGDRLGPLLVQLPPSLVFKRDVVSSFFSTLRDRFAGQLACEPRHRTWFTSDVDRLLSDFHVARVAADPAVVPQAAEPAGWSGLVYFRLHGSPQMYYSPYSEEYLDALAAKIRTLTAPTWCIFDNTARFHAQVNALGLLRRLQPVPCR